MPKQLDLGRAKIILFIWDGKCEARVVEKGERLVRSGRWMRLESSEFSAFGSPALWFDLAASELDTSWKLRVAIHKLELRAGS